MPNRRLTDEQLALAKALFLELIGNLRELSGGDKELYFAYCRRFTTKLIHEERGTPAARNKLKKVKFLEQKGLCPFCGDGLPEKGAELDRFKASDGYTAENTRLVHQKCHRDDQAAKQFQ